ncbi:hypothetical protein EDC04DRAFT_1747278 [Pisolithus marmoratus]|nr:hypothetical protein EDC04DRAFT_1747278 [Pisolithus marmoratus]
MLKDPSLIATALLGAPADVMLCWAYLVEPANGNWENFKLQVVQQYPEIELPTPRASKDPSLSCECASGNSCACRVLGRCSRPLRLVSRPPLPHRDAVDSLIPEWQVRYLAWKESHPSVFAPSSCPPRVSCSTRPHEPVPSRKASPPLVPRSSDLPPRCEPVNPTRCPPRFAFMMRALPLSRSSDSKGSPCRSHCEK